MKDFWNDQPGSTNTNWFKDHPKATLLILTGVIVLIVVISI